MSDQSKDLSLVLAWAYFLVSGGLFCIGIVLVVLALAARAANFIPTWAAVIIGGCGVIALIVGNRFWRKATS